MEVKTYDIQAIIDHVQVLKLDDGDYIVLVLDTVSHEFTADELNTLYDMISDGVKKVGITNKIIMMPSQASVESMSKENIQSIIAHLQTLL